MLTLVLIICCAAIFCFFSQEFFSIFKRIFEVRGAKEILPLAFASYFVYNYDYLILWGLTYIQEVLLAIVGFVDKVLPFQKQASYILMICLLTLISVGPVIILDILSRRKYYKPYAYPYTTSTLLWIIGAMLLVVLPLHN